MNILLSILLAIVINGHSLRIMTNLPEHTAQSVMLVKWKETDYILAHNWLAGRYFYELNIGDTVLVLRDNSESKYTIKSIRVTSMTLYEDDFHPGLYLVTCWPKNGRPIGRLIIELSKKAEKFIKQKR